MFARVEWGTVDGWVSGVGTIFAVAVALWFSYKSERDLRELRVASVHGWFELTSTSGGRHGTLWIYNNTDLPIYTWNAVVSWLPTGRDVAVQIETGSPDLGLLPPGKHDFRLNSSDKRPLPENDASVSVTLRFTDVLGRQRFRSPLGNLK